MVGGVVGVITFTLSVVLALLSEELCVTLAVVLRLQQAGQHQITVGVALVTGEEADLRTGRGEERGDRGQERGEET